VSGKRAPKGLGLHDPYSRWANKSIGPGPEAGEPVGRAGHNQPDQRVWAPSQGSPQVGGGQSPGPAGWPAPRKAPEPQTWRQQQQRRKAVNDRLVHICIHVRCTRMHAPGSSPPSTHTHTHTHTYEGALPTAIYYGTDSHLQEDNTRSHLGHPAASQLLLPTLQDQHQAPALSHLCGWVGLPILAPLPP
jgi:hypothetical protein